MVMGHQKNKRRKISVHGATLSRRIVSESHFRRDCSKSEAQEKPGYVQMQEENQAFGDNGTALYNPLSVSLDDDSFVTTVSCLELSPPEETSCYHTAAESFFQSTENIDPMECVKSNNKVLSIEAEKALLNINSRLCDTKVTMSERAEVDQLIAYLLFLLTKRRHHPTDVNSNCIEREPFTFKKFLQLFRTARSASPEKEKRPGLIEGLLHRTETRSNFFAKKNTLPFGLLLNALSFTMDAEGDSSCEAVKNLVHNESNEPSTESSRLHLFFNAFITAYFGLRNSPAESSFFDLLEYIASNKPGEQGIRRALNFLSENNFKSVGCQTEIDHRKYQQRGRGMNRDRCTVIEMKRNARRAKMAADEINESANESSSFKSDDLQDAPLPKAIVKPRSVSRHRRFCINSQISSMSSSNFEGSSCNSTEFSANDSYSMSFVETTDSGLSSSVPIPPVPCMTSTPIKSPPPPPPPLPPPPSFLASPWMRPTMLSPFAVVKSENTYNGSDACESNFSEEQRDRLEKVFEKVKKTSQDLQLRFGNKTLTPLVQILNEKKALSLGIVLAKFRPVTVTELVEMLESQAVHDLDADTLDTLLKHYPLEEELSLFNKYTSPELLKDAELFCYLASRRPLLQLRIQLKVITDFLKTDLVRQSECVNILLKACKTVHNSTSINGFLRRCLQFGNFLNQSSFAAHASGFTLNSLLDILRTKGTSENVRFVDILAETAEPCLKDVVNNLAVLKEARGNTVDDLEKAVGITQRRVKNAMKDLQECGEEKLCELYAPPLRESIKKYDHLMNLLVEIRNKEKELQVFYCTPAMSLEKILATLTDAFSLFQEAIEVAKEKELRRSRQCRKFSAARKDSSNTLPKRCRNYLQSPSVKDLVYLLDTTDV